MKISVSIGALVALAGIASAQVVLTGTSYSQNFDTLGSGLPTGWTVRTAATASALGTVATPVLTANAATGGTSTNWGDTSGRFFNAASSTGLVATTTGANQATATDRALAVRQTSGFGDPGAAFVIQIQNTTGFENFAFSFASELLSEQGRTTTWTVDFAIGATPTSFTALSPTISQSTFGEQSNSFTLPASVDNLSGPLWIRVVALTASTGSNNRDSFGIDNFDLTYRAVIPTPGAAALLGLGGLTLARRRRTA